MTCDPALFQRKTRFFSCPLAAVCRERRDAAQGRYFYLSLCCAGDAAVGGDSLTFYLLPCRWSIYWLYLGLNLLSQAAAAASLSLWLARRSFSAFIYWKYFCIKREKRERTREIISGRICLFFTFCKAQGTATLDIFLGQRIRWGQIPVTQISVLIVNWNGENSNTCLWLLNSLENV